MLNSIANQSPLVCVSLACTFLMLDPRPAAADCGQSRETLHVGDSPIMFQGTPQHTDMTPDGRKILFETTEQFDVKDGNASRDIYMYDLDTGAVTLVSSNDAGFAGDQESLNGRISNDGKYAIFFSQATNFPKPKAGTLAQVWRKNLEDGTLELVSQTPSGERVNGSAFGEDIDADGDVVVFWTLADDVLPPGTDTNFVGDLYVRDFSVNSMTRVLGFDGAVPVEPIGEAGEARISDNGRFIAFTSEANNIVPGSVNAGDTVYLHDRIAGPIANELISRNTSGIGDPQIPDGPSFQVTISGDASRVAFLTEATDVVGGDANGTKADMIICDRANGNSLHRIEPAVGGQTVEEIAGVELSHDGRHIAFSTEDTGVVANQSDTNGSKDDIYTLELDLVAGATTSYLAHVSTAGVQGVGSVESNVHFGPGMVSDGGDIVLFSSHSDNLVGTDDNTLRDVFLHLREQACVRLEPLDQSVLEGNVATVDVVVDGPVDRTISVQLVNGVPGDSAVRSPLATAGDYQALPSETLEFEPGGPTRVTRSYPIRQDGIVEPEHSFRVQIANVTGAAGDGDRAKVRIRDNQCFGVPEWDVNAIYTQPALVSWDSQYPPNDDPAIWRLTHHSAGGGPDPEDWEPGNPPMWSTWCCEVKCDGSACETPLVPCLP